MMTIDGEQLRKRLITARIALGLSRREMAAQLLTPYSTYEQWEHGRYRTPGVAIVAAELMVIDEAKEAMKAKQAWKSAWQGSPTL